MSQTNEPLRDFEQAAAYLHISESWLRKQVAKRRVPHTRFGRSVRFSAADLAQIVAASSVAAAPSPTSVVLRHERRVRKSA